MSRKGWFFGVITRASVIMIGGYAVPLFGVKLVTNQKLFGTLMIASLILSVAIATWWAFRKLKVRYSSREAQAVATAFAISAPIALLISMIFGEFSGGYADLVFRSRYAVLLGVFLGVTLLTLLATSAACVLVLSVTQRVIKLESGN
jgi:hypothetical protein